MTPRDETQSQKRIVCAALRKDGDIIIGPRHFDATMRRQIEDYSEDYCIGYWKSAEQGFIDQFGNFHSREDALIIAIAAGQILRRCGGDTRELFSENLY